MRDCVFFSFWPKQKERGENQKIKAHKKMNIFYHTGKDIHLDSNKKDGCLVSFDFETGKPAFIINGNFVCCLVVTGRAIKAIAYFIHAI
jgi:hypothetical protein